jgi:hypothetical protein
MPLSDGPPFISVSFRRMGPRQRRRLGNNDDAALDRPLEDRPRMPLLCQRPSRWGGRRRYRIVSISRLPERYAERS